MLEKVDGAARDWVPRGAVGVEQQLRIGARVRRKIDTRLRKLGEELRQLCSPPLAVHRLRHYAEQGPPTARRATGSDTRPRRAASASATMDV